MNNIGEQLIDAKQNVDDMQGELEEAEDRLMYASTAFVVRHGRFKKGDRIVVNVVRSNYKGEKKPFKTWFIVRDIEVDLVQRNTQILVTYRGKGHYWGRLHDIHAIDGSIIEAGETIKE